ncbi:hypothetical protein [Roseateles sp.]|uniref:hypothetical protein n=1 Tax=Roseateles sp. TaxID=1971397 RepID=UPI00396474C8
MPKNPTEAIASVPTPIVKLRRAKSRRSTTECSAVSVQATKTTSAIAATTASATMSGELNQSSSLPLSSITWSAPIPRVSITMPVTLTGTGRFSDSKRPRMPWSA